MAELSDPDAGNSKNEHTGRANSDKENPDNSSLTSLSSSLASQEDDFLGSDFQVGGSKWSQRFGHRGPKT